MVADALLIIPPLFKTLSQPLLGPAMLAGAGRAAGHRVTVLDLNQRYLRMELPVEEVAEAAPYVGDHNRPTPLLRDLQARFSAVCRAVLPSPDTAGLTEDAALTLTYGHAEVVAAARALARGPLGVWVREALGRHAPPGIVGLSIFWSGQVLFGLVVSLVARDLWPGVALVWGGPHVTALEREIARDARYAADMIDGFAFGYAEATWVAVLDAVAAGTAWPVEIAQAGAGVVRRALPDGSVVPAFDDLTSYGWGRLCLPAQSTRGCAYGKCTYCTYPTVEGRYRKLPLDPVEAVVRRAQAIGAAVAFKDALVVPGRLDELASLIDGRVHWSACTKLHRRLADSDWLRRLVDCGLRTLEIGLETLTDAGQLLMDKRQALPLLLGFLDAAAAAGVAVVVNYMTGLPGLDALEEIAWLQRVHSELAVRQGLVAKVEHNTMQVERRSAMGMAPEGFRLRVIRTWPWASVVAWGIDLDVAA